MRFRPSLLALMLAAPAGAFQPSSSLVVMNAASHWPAQTGSRGLAPGSRITIQLANRGFFARRVEISLRAGAREVPLPVLALHPNTIETRLPDRLASGTYDLRIRSGGQAVQTVALKVTPVSFGIYSRNGKGYGPGQIDEEKHPIARLFGEGLGRESKVEVIVGGRHAKALSIRRTGDGKDEIDFEIPKDATPGCYVPLQTRIGEVLSNTVTIAIAGRAPCITRPEQPVPGWFSGPAGLVALIRAVTRETVDSPDEVHDEVVAAFFENSDQTGLGPLAYIPPDGQCMTSARFYDSNESTPETFRAALFDDLGGQGLDAGQMLSIHDGHRQIRIPTIRDTAGFYRRPMPAGFFDNPVLHVTGAGGAAVSSFALSLPPPASFLWTNRPPPPTIRAADGLAVKWEGVAAGTTMLVIAATADPVRGILATCNCAVPAQAAGFRIRPEYLAHLTSGGGPGSPGVVILLPWPSKPDAAIDAAGIQQSAAVRVFVYAANYVFR